MEVAKRELEVPFLDFADNPDHPVSRQVDWDEYLERAYLFWTPRAWLALRAEYLFERFKRDALFPEEL